MGCAWLIKVGEVQVGVNFSDRVKNFKEEK